MYEYCIYIHDCTAKVEVVSPLATTKYLNMLVFFLELREALLHYNPPGPETTYSADLFFSREKFTSYFFRLLELKSVWYFCSIFYSY